ncbi:hypothetical protein [Sporosarcina ureilytica]|uniref:Uncharacterized protein n=1 Tax=Sporosarcina ureilytica TaxID=298596 RepID=A0A1D8JH13_9BACL|nr:hypothetical protein [Sporosarcina ureilytica]AOV08010.1 hypothetical protein BI350_10990 [Sporosarcina ureilytica]
MELYISLLASKNIDGTPYVIIFNKPEDRSNPNKYKNLNQLPFEEVYKCLTELEEYKAAKINYINPQ